MDDKTSQVEQLTRDDWIEAALKLFEVDGPQAVRVDAIAKSLKISRGSFYWHFENRADLLNALLERWIEEKTKTFIEKNEAKGGDPHIRLRRLLNACAEDDGRLELSIRDWAKEDSKARKVLRKVDEHRTQYLAKLISACGYQEKESQARSRIAYLSWLGLYSHAAISSADQRIELMDGLCNFLLSVHGASK